MLQVTHTGDMIPGPVKWVIFRVHDPVLWRVLSGVVILPEMTAYETIAHWQRKFNLEILTVYLVDCYRLPFQDNCRCRKCWYNGFYVHP